MPDKPTPGLSAREANPDYRPSRADGLTRRNLLAVGAASTALGAGAGFLAGKAANTDVLSSLRPHRVPTTESSGNVVAADALAFDVTDHGVVSDSGATDNLAALNKLIASVPEGSEVYFPPAGDSFCGVSGQILISKSITLSGHWNRGSINGPLVGSVLGPTNEAAHLAMGSLLKISSSRVKIYGLALLGKPTKEKSGTLTINGSTLALSSLTATSALIGARVSGPQIPTGTTVSAIDAGKNTVTLSKPVTGESITAARSDANTLELRFKGDHDLNPGDTINLSGFTPSGYDGTWKIGAIVDWQSVQISSSSNPGAASVIGTYTAEKSSCEVWFGADGLEFDTEGEQVHDCNVERLHVEGFGQGVSLGKSDHVTFSDCEIAGCYDGVAYLPSNGFDFSFIASIMVGNVRSSHHIGADASVVNLSCIRTHLGWSEYGICQDVTTNGNGLQGLTMIASPVEHISRRHVRLSYGGGMLIDPCSYWTWSDGTPPGPAFTVSEQQNYGNIDFMATLTGTNPHAPYLYYAGAQVNSGVFRMLTPLGSFAAAVFPNNGYTSIRSIVPITTSTTLGASAGIDYVAIIGAGGAPVLPTAVGNSNRYTLKNSTGGTVLVGTTSSQTIDGSPTFTLPPLAAIDVISDNANWWVI